MHTKERNFTFLTVSARISRCPEHTKRGNKSEATYILSTKASFTCHFYISHLKRASVLYKPENEKRYVVSLHLLCFLFFFFFQKSEPERRSYKLHKIRHVCASNQQNERLFFTSTQTAGKNQLCDNKADQSGEMTNWSLQGEIWTKSAVNSSAWFLWSVGVVWKFFLIDGIVFAFDPEKPSDALTLIRRQKQESVCKCCGKKTRPRRHCVWSIRSSQPKTHQDTSVTVDLLHTN